MAIMGFHNNYGFLMAIMGLMLGLMLPMEEICFMYGIGFNKEQKKTTVHS